VCREVLEVARVRTIRLIVSGALGALVFVGALAGGSGAGERAVAEGTYSSENFTITWVDDPSDPNAPDLADLDGDGVPDAVTRIVAALESARAFMLTDLGYHAPPVDVRYPVQIAIGDDRGYTQALPGGIGNSRPSFTVVPPRYVRSSTSDAEMRAFAVHEYFHAVQNGYDYSEAAWIGEASSAWVEDLFVDDADPNHEYLVEFVPFPRRPLHFANTYAEYGAFLFLQFLTERHGGGSVAGAGLVRELWELMAVPEGITGAPDLSPAAAITAVVERHGSNMQHVWGEFLLWRLQLGRFEEGAPYRDAVGPEAWPVWLRTTSVRAESCRLSSDADSEEKLPPLSGDFVRVRPHSKGPGHARAVLTVEGPAGTTGFFVVAGRKVAAQELLLFDADGVARAPVRFGTKQVRAIKLGLGNAHTEEDATLAYSLRLEGRSRTEMSPPSGVSSVFYGTSALVTGTVTCRGAPAPFANVMVTERTADGGSQTFVEETNETGRWQLGVTPTANAVYTAELVDPLLSRAVAEGQHELGVHVLVSMQLADDRPLSGSPVIVDGDIMPAHPGAKVALEYRRPELEWELGTEVAVDGASRYHAEFLLPGPRIWQVRARVVDTGDSDHLPATSGAEIVDVQG
jgi:hypothetical protein